MQLLAWYRIIPIFVTISSLVFNTEAYPIKPVHADTPNPPSAKSFLSGIRRSSSPEKVDAGLVSTEEKISKMTPAQRSKLKKELDEMVHGPKPKTRLGRLWDRILKFFQRRRRPFADIADKTKHVGAASARSLWTGFMLGGFGASFTLLAARIANLFPC